MNPYHILTIRRPLRRLAPIGILAALLLAVPIVGCDDGGDAAGDAAGVDEANLLTVSHTAADHDAGGTCFICDPSKRDEGRLWCTEHARYEDRCWMCQPQLEDPDRLYCVEHGLYEDECRLCDPSRGNADDAAGGGEGAAAGSPELMCQEHGVAEIDCAICQPQRAGELAAGESLKVRMASGRSAELAGIATQRPSADQSAAVLELLGEIRYDGNRRARVTPLAGGVVAEVLVDVGEEVAAGQPLAAIKSAEVADAKADYLSAIARVEVTRAASEREARLVEDEIGAARDAEAAEAEYRLAELDRRKAEQALLNLGFTPAEVGEIADSGSSSSELIVRAPFDSTVVEREAVLGEAVEAGRPLFELADLSTMWVELAVPEEQATTLRPGMPVDVRVKALAGEPLRGELVWLSPQVNERTRMVRARASVPNDRGVLRHGMFAEVRAGLEAPAETLVVPGEAVQDIDGLAFVFVKAEPDLYEARRVEVGPAPAGGGRVAVSEGLDPADEVVVAGGFTMKTEFLKSRLGAGCVDD